MAMRQSGAEDVSGFHLGNQKVELTSPGKGKGRGPRCGDGIHIWEMPGDISLELSGEGHRRIWRERVSLEVVGLGMAVKALRLDELIRQQYGTGRGQGEEQAR